MILKKLYISICYFLFLKAIFILNAQNSQIPQSLQRPGTDNITAVDLSRATPLWTSITSGNAIFAPQVTKSGFVMAGDGKLLFNLSEKGKLLWQRSLPGANLSNIVVTDDNFFICIVKDYGSPNRVCMVNPSGNVLWKKSIPIKIISSILAWNGQLYAMGNNCVVCISMNGYIRWVVSTKSLNENFAPCGLNDGSIMIFHKETVNGHSVATRLDSFGKKIEEITFTGEISSLYNVSNGTILTFTDGTLALVSCIKGELCSMWTLDKLLPALSTPRFLNVTRDKVCVLYGKGSTQIFIIDIKTAETVFSFNVREIDFSSLLCIEGYTEDFFICDNTYLALYTYEGKRLATAKLLPKDKWQHVFSPCRGIVAFSSEDWVVQGFRIYRGKEENSFSSRLLSSQNFAIRVNAISQGAKDKNNGQGYKTFDITKINDISKNLKEDHTKENDSSITKKGEAWEALILEELGKVHDSFLNTPTSSLSSVISKESNYYQSHLDYSKSIIEAAAALSSSKSQSSLASIVRDCNETSILQTTLRAIQTFPYDPQMEFLDAIGVIVYSNKYSKNRQLIFSTVDAIYALCSYNGEAAFLEKGRQLFSALMTTPYDAPINAYARLKLGELWKI